MNRLAALGGTPRFDKPVPVGQLNFPEWSKVEQSFRGIFERRYYTNHGPLAQELEQRLEEFFGVSHVICMTNATIALMIAAVALELKGKVITPAFTFIATSQSLTWAGLEPVFCDVDADTHQISVPSAESLMSDDISAILAVHLWSNPCDTIGLQQLADEYGVKLYYDSAHAFGSKVGGVPVGNLGELEVFSFHATKILNGMEGGCICTDDDNLAARLRNIRSSYGSGPAVDIPYTGNGRLSEAQAAMALLSLDQYADNLKRNKAYQSFYRSQLEAIPGIRFPQQLPDTSGNDQYVVFEVDESKFGLNRDQLVNALRAENVHSRRYFTPGIHRSVPYVNEYPQFVNSLSTTDRLCGSVMQLPSGQAISEEMVKQLVELVEVMHECAPQLRKQINPE